MKVVEPNDGECRLSHRAIDCGVSKFVDVHRLLAGATEG